MVPTGLAQLPAGGRLSHQRPLLPAQGTAGMSHPWRRERARMVGVPVSTCCHGAGVVTFILNSFGRDNTEQRFHVCDPGALKLIFHHKLSPVPCPNDDSCLPFMIMPTHFVSCTSALDLSRTSALKKCYYYYFK